MPPDNNRRYNTVYVPAELRKYLEKTVLEIAYMRNERLTASSFVQFLIKNYGEDAKKIYLSQVGK